MAEIVGWVGTMPQSGKWLLAGTVLTVIGALVLAMSGFLGMREGDDARREAKLEITRVQSQADVKIASSTAIAAQADAKAEQLRADNLALAGQVEEEKVRRLRLEEKVAQRTFTNDQSIKLKNALSDKVGRVFVQADGDSEAGHYAGLLSMALEAAGHYAGGWSKIGDNHGVSVFLVTERRVEPDEMANDPLKIALEHAGVRVIGWGSGFGIYVPKGVKNLEEGDRLLTVGSKPLDPDRDVPIIPPHKIGESRFFIQHAPKAAESSKEQELR